jgi:hypothetical protein
VGNGRIGLNQDFTTTRRAARFKPSGPNRRPRLAQKTAPAVGRADTVVSGTKRPPANF